MVDYAARLTEAMTDAGVDIPALAKSLGLSYQAVRKVVDGKSKSFSAANNAKAAKRLGVRGAWLADGSGPKRHLLGQAGTGGVHERSANVYQLGTDAQNIEPALSADAVLVPLYANGASMGPGSDVLHEDVMVGHLPLSGTWVQRYARPTSAAALRLLHAYGDSMSPTFNDGDMLLVDTGARDVANIEGIYVLRANDRLYVKRVRRRMDGQFEVSSDNPTVKTVDVLDGRQPIDVAGRVIWAWNGKKL